MQLNLKPMLHKSLLSIALSTATFMATAGDLSPRAAEPSTALDQGRAFVAAFNLGDRDALTQYLQQHLSSEALKEESVSERVGDLMSLHSELGDVTVEEASGMTHFVVLNVRSNSVHADADVIVLANTKDSGKLDLLRLVRNAPENLDMASSLR